MAARGQTVPVWQLAAAALAGALLAALLSAASRAAPRDGAPRFVAQPVGAPLAEPYLWLMRMALTGSLTDEAGRCNPGAGGNGCLLDKLLPYEPELRERGNDWPPFGHTMIGHLRLRNIETLLREAVAGGVPGAFAELGVWRGGACVYARAVLNVLGEVDRPVLAFDAFDAIARKTDGYARYGLQGADFIATDQATVTHNFEKYFGALPPSVRFHPGFFNESTKAFREGAPRGTRIAVLRVDGNFYDSYQDVMYNLYEFVPVGGYVIFDDILGFPDVQRFWSDFKADQGLVEELVQIDDFSTWFKKVRDVKIDFSKKRSGA
ncbi:hypothetical protein Rsub_09018 [Raphidocelis subcapitata]|uniref:Macrocin O-methyltransferase n=1 Tax=Raphidocelis subcapitata TaxID=307507 RepID=A0A2V0PAQ6_9CHLO|nr:hypothetical protein Rsub_09018 [Raphidocelis subcapitata]|eukprot:GBF96938.1 hypothetical protein Rsub_09018 [Raphidocelis subcapitata]